jgi:hypothetical protein
MKKLIVITALCLLSIVTHAQFIVGTVLNQTVGRVIRAIDLQVQRLQNQTIWLQNAQKVIENELNQLELNEIAGYSGDQQKLFSEYYNELWQIKSYLSTYQRVKNLTVRQAQLVSSYKQGWNLFHNDSHFSVAELNQMQLVYTGILNDSVKNLEQLVQAISAGKTRMSDEQRLEVINKVSNELDGNYRDLQQFNQQNQMLSFERAKDQNELATLKIYYGLH